MISVLLLIPVLSVLGYLVHRKRVQLLQSELGARLAEQTRGLVEDRDEAVRRVEELATLDRARRRVLVGLLNELRTPLMMIKSPLHAGRYAAAGDGIDEADLERMMQEANRLQKGVDQIQAVLELELGLTTIDLNSHDFIGMIDRLVSSLKPLADRYGVTLTFKANRVELPFAFDAARIEEAVHSLVERAFGDVKPGDSVSFLITTTSEEGDNTGRVVLEISDNGSPIEDAYLHVLRSNGDWTAFDSSSSSATALGLALARRYAELHGGDLVVDAIGESGTRVRLSLPLRSGDEPISGDGEMAYPTRRHLADRIASGEHEAFSERDERVSVTTGDASVDNLGVGSADDPDAASSGEKSFANQDDAHPAQAGDSEDRHAEGADHAESAGDTDMDIRTSDKETTVLIVDDHAETRRYLAYALRKYHNVVEASNGAEALEIIRRVDPDLVLSDIMMPVMDGNEMCRRIKSDDGLSHTPVFLVTANTVTDLRKEGLESGADDYFVKPFDLDEAILRINNEIKTRNELRRRYRREVVMRPSDITVTSADEAFLNRAREIVEEHIDDGMFGVQELASELGLSARQLQRRLRDTLDRSPVEFIRTLRLQRAAQLLEAEYGNVSEVAYSVGFTSLSYFAKCFREQFGSSPSEYKAKQAA